MAEVDDFARKYGFDPETEVPLLRKGALVAQSPADFENMLELTDDDRDSLRKEITHRYVKFEVSATVTWQLRSLQSYIDGDNHGHFT
jgi:hypothetical protein